jgi:hypothetical protein
VGVSGNRNRLGMDIIWQVNGGTHTWHSTSLHHDVMMHTVRDIADLRDLLVSKTPGS